MSRRKKLLSAFIITASIAATGVTGFAVEPINANQEQKTITQGVDEKTEAVASLTYTGQIAWHHADIQFKVHSEHGYEEVMNGKSIKLQGVTLFEDSKVEYNESGLTIKIKEGYKITQEYLNQLLGDFEGYPEGVEKVEVTYISRSNVKASSVRSASTTLNGGVYSPAQFIEANISPEENKITFDFEGKLDKPGVELIKGDEILSEASVSIEDENNIVISSNDPNSKFDLSDTPKLEIVGENPVDIFIERREEKSEGGNLELTVAGDNSNAGVVSTEVGNVDGQEYIASKEAYSPDVVYDGAEISPVKMNFTVNSSDENKESLNGKQIKLIGHGLSNSWAKWTGDTLKVVLGSGGKSEEDLENLINSQLQDGTTIDVDFISGSKNILPTAFDKEVFAPLSGGLNGKEEIKETITVEVTEPSATGRLDVSLTDGKDTFSGKVLVKEGDSKEVVANKIIARLNNTGVNEKYGISKDGENNIVVTQKGNGSNIDIDLTVE